MRTELGDKMTTKIKTINPDGTVETITTDDRSLADKLTGELTWKEKLDAMFPTSDEDVTEGWTQYDEHKLFN